MIPKQCKRLAEVDFPIAVVSRHAAREKSIRHGHPSTLHLWWARRPLAACRSMLLALLLPDPCDPHCPAEFKTQARRILEDSRLPGRKPKTDADLRAFLLAFIGDFADWDHSGNRAYLEVARGLVKAAHPEETPLVVDPFAGGGSIPLEALRIGCDAFASDLNPVACLICKVLLEDIPRHGPELAEELRRVGAEVKKAAEKELAEFYPVDADGARPIAYLWARTVRCEAPNCGAEIPLMRSFWLSKKANRRRALRCKVVRGDVVGRICNPAPSQPDYKSGLRLGLEFEIFEPLTENEVRGGTVSRAKATCVCCNTVLTPDRVRAQLAGQRGGADVVFDAKGLRTGGARLLAVVTLRDGDPGRHYRLPTDADYRANWKAYQRLTQVVATKRADGLSPIPDEPTPAGGGSGAGRAFSVQKYGMMTWSDLFTSRQKVTMEFVNRSIAQAPTSTDIKQLLCCIVSRAADKYASLIVWHTGFEKVEHVFGRQALSMVWDYCEANPLSDATGGLESQLDWIMRVVEAFPRGTKRGQVQIDTATRSSLPDSSAGCWFTDPPYYDAIPYSDLSDFFLVWLKRTLPGHPLLRDPFDPTNPLSPKLQEAVQDETKKVNGKPKDRAFFEATMAKAFAEGRRVLREDGIGSVVFAHKTTEGWEALLGGLIRGGWTITGSWPISTEMATRLRARESAALATSVHLVCRPRPEDAPVGDWAQVLRELPRRVADWMNRLQHEGIRGADLVFACIGPALEIYSGYARVVDAEEREIPLGGDPEARDPHKRGYLAYVWEVVGRAALEQVLGTAEARARDGSAGALEEDARLTALFLWTLQATTQDAEQSGDESPHSKNEEEEAEDEEDETATSKKKKKGLTLPFDVVRRFAQPLGIHLEAWEGRCIETEKGIARLIPVLDRARQLFGEEGADAVGDRLEKHRAGPAIAVSGRGRTARAHQGPQAARRGGGVRRVAAQAPGCHDARPCPCGDAAAIVRPGQRPAGAAEGRDRTRPGLPASGQCPVGALSEGQRRETAARCDASGGAEMKAQGESHVRPHHV
jgi:adenine-specific DNA methylase